MLQGLIFSPSNISSVLDTAKPCFSETSPGITQNFLSTSSVGYYRTDPIQAESSSLPLLHSACFCATGTTYPPGSSGGGLVRANLTPSRLSMPLGTIMGKSENRTGHFLVGARTHQRYNSGSSGSKVVEGMLEVESCFGLECVGGCDRDRRLVRSIRRRREKI